MRSRRALLVTLVAVNALYAFNQMLVVPILPTIERDFDADTGRVTWILSVFLIVSCVATPIIGRLSDQFGRRRLLLGVLALFFCGSVLAAVAPNIWVLIAARALQAASGALAPLAIGLLRDLLPPDRLHRAIGMIMAVTMAGGGLGAATSGIVVDWLDWRVLFAISSAIILASFVLVAVAAPPDPRGESVPVDVRGAAMLSAGLLALLIALTEGARWGWTSAAILGLLAGSAGIFTLWIRFEQRVPWPLVDVRQLRERSVLIANIAQLLSSFSMTVLIVLVPRIVVASPEPPGGGGSDVGYGLAASTTMAGLYLLPISVAGLVAGPLAGRIARRFGFRAPLVAGQLIGGAALALLIPWHDRPWHMILASLCFGLSIPLVNTAVNGIVVDAVRAADVGVSAGVLVVFRQIGATVGSQLTAGVLTSAVVVGTLVPTEAAFQIAFAIGMATAIVGALLVVSGVSGQRGKLVRA
jgi:MFS family permease